MLTAPAAGCSGSRESKASHHAGTERDHRRMFLIHSHNVLYMAPVHPWVELALVQL